MRPRRVARHLRFLPRRQTRIGVRNQLFGLLAEAADFFVDIDRSAAMVLPVGFLRRQLAQLLDFTFELGDAFFKLKKYAHPTPLFAPAGVTGKAPSLS